MYLIGIIIFVLVSIFAVIGSTGKIAYYVDVYSLLTIVLLVIPMLAAAGAFKDLNRAFRYALNKKMSPSVLELNRARNAVVLTRNLIVFSGVLSCLIGFVSLMVRLDDVSRLGPNLSVMVISLVYAVIFSMILLPIECRLKNMEAELKEQ